MFTTKIISTICITSALIACGGSSDPVVSGITDSSETPTPKIVASVKSFDLGTANANYIKSGETRKFTVSDITGDNQISGTGTYTSSAASTLAVDQYIKTIETKATIVSNGASIIHNEMDSIIYYQKYEPRRSSGSTNIEVTKFNSFPTAGKVNDSGELYTQTNYLNEQQLVAVGTTTVNYYVVADTADTVVLTLIGITKNTSDSVTFTSTTKYRVTADNMSLISRSVYIPAIKSAVLFTYL